MTSYSDFASASWRAHLLPAARAFEINVVLHIPPGPLPAPVSSAKGPAAGYLELQRQIPVILLLSLVKISGKRSVHGVNPQKDARIVCDGTERKSSNEKQQRRNCEQKAAQLVHTSASLHKLK